MRRSGPLIAALWMLGAAVSFSAMAVAGREIQTEMDTFELMLYRSLIGFAVVAMIVARRPGGFAAMHSPRPGLHVGRNIVHFAGQNLWFYAIATIPLGQVVALEFTNPLWVALLAPVLLDERFTRVRLFTAALGLAGVMLIARPGASPLGLGHAAALLAALGFAMTTIYTKRIMQFDPVLCVLFWMTLSQSIMAFALSLPGGIPWPSAALAPSLLVVGLTGLTAHFCLTAALGHAPASVVAPMEFVRLPVFALAGLWLYGEPIRAAVILGAVLIVAANVINVRAERARAAA